MHRILLLAVTVLILERDQLLADLSAARAGVLRLTKEEQGWMTKRMKKLNTAIAKAAAGSAKSRNKRG